MHGRPAHALFFYLGAFVGVSWTAWRAWDAGPFAVVAAWSRELRARVSPPPPPVLRVRARLPGGAPGSHARGRTWWVPPERAEDAEHGPACAEPGDARAGTFALIRVRAAGISVGGADVQPLEAGALPAFSPPSGLLAPLAARLQAVRAQRWSHWLDPLCADGDPDRFLLVVDPDVPPETEAAVLRTMCLVGVRADRPLSASPSPRRPPRERQHAWRLGDEVPLAAEPPGACDAGLDSDPLLVSAEDA